LKGLAVKAKPIAAVPAKTDMYTIKNLGAGQIVITGKPVPRGKLFAKRTEPIAAAPAKKSPAKAGP
jgi:hypothetical protein